MYTELERQFLEFDEIVPYFRNNNIRDLYSPRLVVLMQSAAPQIEGMLKILTKLLKVKSSSEHFPALVKALNSGNVLSIQEIQLRENMKTIKPFVLDSDNSTDWWKANNASKHDFPNGIYKVKYSHIVDALAALAITHEIAEYALAWGHPDLMINSKNWNKMSMSIEGFQASIRKPFSFEHSRMFYYFMGFSPIAHLFE